MAVETGMSLPPRLLDDARVCWGRRSGFGSRPALLVIDVQNYMIGEVGARDNNKHYPFSCGKAAVAALGHIRRLLLAARAVQVPVIFTRFIIDFGSDAANQLHRKLDVGPDYHENLYFEGSHGSRIANELAPLDAEPVIDKAHRSAFFSTPLLDLLHRDNIDCCIIVGGSTSGCIRPTATDAEQNGFRVIIPEEAVFDRVEASHAINLFDMDRSVADVLPIDDVIAHLTRLAG